GLLAVDPRPRAARAARGEALQEALVVETLAAPVDPAEADRVLEHLGVAHALDAGRGLGDRDPDTGCARVVLLEPHAPLGGRRERVNGQTVVGWHGRSLGARRPERPSAATPHARR